MSSLPEKVDIKLYDWSTGRHRFNLNKADGTPNDLTNYKGELQAKDTYGGTLLIHLQENNGLKTDASGFVDLIIDGDEIGPADWTVLVYDLFLIHKTLNYRVAVVTGTISIDPSVSTF